MQDKNYKNMNKTVKNLSCWVVTEGLVGTENQCLGVAEALGIAPEIKHVHLRQPWKALSPYLGFEQSWSFGDSFQAPWPDLVLASGRKAIAAARYIKKQSPDTFVTFIQDPRMSAKPFDLIAVPAHDNARGENVIVTTAAPNRITQEKLEHAKQQFPQFESIPSPRVAVLIGGTSKAYNMTSAVMTTLCDHLKPLEVGLMITASRRTGVENETILREHLKNTESYIWDGTGENPYLAMLAWADYILVTADSTSMLSDAATVGKPAYMIPLEGGSKRIDQMHQNLIKHGAIRIFDGNLESWSYEPLKDAEMIATEIKRRMNIQG